MILILVSLLIAYFFTGCEMVFIHIDGTSMDRPAYVCGPLYQKFIVGAIWPYVSKRNEELNWFLCAYIGFGVITAIFLALLTPHLSYVWAIAILLTIRPLPFIGPAFNILCTLISSPLFALLSLFFKWKIPGAIERFNSEQEYRQQQRKFRKQFRRLG